MSDKNMGLVAAHTTATTYHFQTTGTGWKSWALCTVNDETGELLITSDWGNWSHRWNTDHLGHQTLTAFIGEGNDVDYIARKLQGRSGGKRFSAERTIAAWRKMLCETRRENGHRRNAKLTRDLAREIWDALGDAAEDYGNSADLFLSRVYEIRGFTDHVDDTPYGSIETEQTPEDEALRERILPALIAACAEANRARTAAATEGATR